jgi:hypothetical protein
MGSRGGEVKTLMEEVKVLESELKRVRGGWTTRDASQDITKYVKDHQEPDPLVSKQVTPFTQAKGSGGCCG